MTATARIEHREVEKVVTTTEKVKTVVLELSEEHARTLASVLARVAGNPKTTYRGDAEDVLVALQQAGFYWLSRPMRVDPDGPSLLALDRP